MVGDIVLTVLTLFAAFTQVLVIRDQWVKTRCAYLSTLLHLAGWFVLSVRFLDFMFVKGDLPITPPSVVALMCLALAEIIATALNQRK
jgi:hypothetical protein